MKTKIPFYSTEDWAADRTIPPTPTLDEITGPKKTIVSNPEAFLQFLSDKGFGDSPVNEMHVELKDIPPYKEVLRRPLQGSLLWSLSEMSPAEVLVFIVNNGVLRIFDVKSEDHNLIDYSILRIFFPHSTSLQLLSRYKEGDGPTDSLEFLSGWTGYDMSDKSSFMMIGKDFAAIHPQLALALIKYGIGGAYVQ